MEDYKIKLEDALKGLSARSAVDILSYMRRHNDFKLDNKTIIHLSYVRMISLSVDQLIELMTQSVLLAYELPDFKLSEQVVKFADMLFDPIREIETYKRVSELLEKNQEQLGVVNISVNGQSLPSLICNWIKDYSLAKEHDALYRMKYIDGSANVKSLNKTQQEILVDIFKLYDKCIEMVAMWDNIEIKEGMKIPENQLRMSDFFPDMEEVDEFDEDISGDSEDESLNIEQLPNSEIKELEVTDNKEDPEWIVPGDSAKKQSIPKPPIEIKPVEIAKPPVPVEPSKPKLPMEVKPVAVPEKPKPIIVEPKPVIAPPKPKQIDEMPFQIGGHVDAKQQAKRGVIYDQDTNIDIAEIEDKAKLEKIKQDAIAVKLQELKNRKNKN